MRRKIVIIKFNEHANSEEAIHITGGQSEDRPPWPSRIQSNAGGRKTNQSRSGTPGERGRERGLREGCKDFQEFNPVVSTSDRRD
jgi:hypothetical protein